MRNALVGFKPSVGLTSRAGYLRIPVSLHYCPSDWCICSVIPQSEHQDSVGTFARTVRDAVYALDAIYGPDPRDNYTLAQIGRTPKTYTQFLTDSKALKGATFGIPWASFWTKLDDEQRATLTALVQLIEDAGATIINGTEILGYETIVSPDGWNWDYGTTRGYANESEYTVVKVDFYNNIRFYLSELSNTKIRSLEDIVQYNYDNDGTEGGSPWPEGGNPAFKSGQDGFLASMATKGVKNETYWQALKFTQSSTKRGIDYALTHYSKGRRLSGLLVPPDVGQTYQVAAQAQYPMITLPAGYHGDSGMPFGLAIMQTMWAEGELVKWGSSIEDLIQQKGHEIRVGRERPKWLGYLQRNLPVPF